MRLDKFLSDMGVASRKETAKAVRAGLVLVNGIPAKSPDQKVDETKDTVAFCGREIAYQKFVYLMLNKPEGYLSATEDGRGATVLDLLPEEYRRMELFPCGRLDKNTKGLLLLTNDGDLCHRLLSPKYHVEKTYALTAKFPISDEDIQTLESGVDLGDFVTKPAGVKRTGEKTLELTITEGKFHQVKRMLEALHNQVIDLERIAFGGLTLPKNLARGDFRPLTETEQNTLFAKGNRTT
ncbi:MAG: rRNA pseudouridine synthase [Clostridia bacterium]|nr:rRNA pseudouridine synthase [Clostridia bacterium]